jgi:ATP-dependent helicase HrpA
MPRRQKARPDPATALWGDGRNVGEALRDYRWHIEELRVSLFAQELGTPRPVSVARLEKRWKEMGSV